ncbi:hypothetical protein CALCODRAFT_520198 [Calocera cornea HHB12733]|uniref:Uncharacterized protein n=1 Tax=Calocera cornea HHB12733 TaxID=1353952 RepID=A0A165DNT0_9BASI|nr:hypothetical protein CALCODRAFT_520198 [Calocera cornea HHB12733]
MRSFPLLTPALFALAALAAPTPCLPSSSAPPAAAASAPPTLEAVATGGVDPSLVLQFGNNPNPNPDGTGNCDGAVKDASGNFIKVPCACPPDRQTFINDLSANVAAGHAVNNPSVTLSFPSGDTAGEQLARLQAMIDTMQNLNGPGQGCPIAATNWGAIQKQLTSVPASSTPAVAAPPPPAASSAPPPAAPAAPPPAAPSAPASSAAATTGGVDPSLVLQFGNNPNPNPDGTGNCDGAVKDASGNFIKVPCACPPDRQTFINDLSANVAAGHAVHNPSVTLSFPSGNTVSEQLARLQAQIDTMQNLNGPGQGCPIAATNWGAIQQQLTSQL